MARPHAAAPPAKRCSSSAIAPSVSLAARAAVRPADRRSNILPTPSPPPPCACCSPRPPPTEPRALTPGAWPRAVSAEPGNEPCTPCSSFWTDAYRSTGPEGANSSAQCLCTAGGFELLADEDGVEKCRCPMGQNLVVEGGDLPMISRSRARTPQEQRHMLRRLLVTPCRAPHRDRRRRVPALLLGRVQRQRGQRPVRVVRGSLGRCLPQRGPAGGHVG